MRTVFAIALAILAVSDRAWAVSPDSCPAPSVLGDSILQRVWSAVGKRKSLKIVVFGTRSSTLSETERSPDAYPARLEANLQPLLPGIMLQVVSYAKPKQTAAEMVKSFGKIINEEKPDLAIWQTGTYDAMHNVDQRVFLANLSEGVDILTSAGVDVILMNMQYNPRTDDILPTKSYAENMRWVARERQVPLFDRYAIMQNWNDTGTIDLYAATKDIAIAKRLHDCLGRALASLIIDAGRLSAIEGKSQR